MTDVSTEATETVETQETGSGLRSQLETVLARNKELEQRELNRSFNEAGLDTTTGLGKAIAKEYKGEATTEAIVEYAKSEYGWEPASEGDPNPLADQIQTEQQKLDTVGQTAGSVPVAPTTPEVLAKAEAEGDYATAMQIKSQQVAEDLFKPRR